MIDYEKLGAGKPLDYGINTTSHKIGFTHY